MLKLAGEVEESIVDGPGIRYVIFFQGCLHHCEGCQNPETWDLQGGKRITVKELVKAVQQDKLVKGVTLSGGDPFYQKTDDLLELCKQLQELGYNIWVYTGYLWEDVKEHPIIPFIDVLVDGQFILDKKSLECRWRGSTNQRLIDVKKTLQEQKVVLYE